MVAGNIPVKDSVRAADYLAAFAEMAGALSGIAQSRVEQPLTLYRGLRGSYEYFPSAPGDAEKAVVQFMEPFIEGDALVSYPLIMAHNHPDRSYPQHSDKDFDALISLTETVQGYVPGARPLSAVVTHADGTTRMQVFQVAWKYTGIDVSGDRLAEFRPGENGLFAKRHEYTLRSEAFRIVDYKLIHNEMPAEQALIKFEFY